MKRVNLFLIIILPAIITGCGENKQSTDDLITVDVNGNYPQKELILQDFLDVEYIPLETTDDFVSMGFIQDIGKEIILDRTLLSSGLISEILLFDKTGKGLRKIDRRGQGPEEYVIIGTTVLLDEENNEIYVNASSPRQMFVYDLLGNFKRNLPWMIENYIFSETKNFDRDHLICYFDAHNYVATFPEREQVNNLYWIISKQDGSIMKEIEIPYKQRKVASIPSTVVNGELIARSVFIRQKKLTPYHNSWVLFEPSSDTIYRYLPDHRLIPFIARTPSIQSMDPEIFLLPGLLTDRYYFMQFVVKKNDNGVFPMTDMAYDKQENTLFEVAVLNDDFTDKRPVHMWHEETVSVLIDGEDIIYAEKLEALELVEAYKNGQLKGKLKEIAAGMDEEDNPVIMVARNKK